MFVERKKGLFSGIVQQIGTVKSVTKKTNLRSLEVLTPRGFTKGLETGASVSVDGVCLTVVEFSENTVVFDVILETLTRTTLSLLAVKDFVNLERSLRFGDEVGGHLVSGHVFGTAEIVEIIKKEDFLSLKCQASCHFADLLFEKGYVAVDGVSLTIGETIRASGEVFFFLHLIPETCRRTTLERKKTGERLNIEIDNQTLVTVRTLRSYQSNQAAVARSY